MKNCFSLGLLIFTLVLMTAGIAPARTFYLSDGSSIEYRKVWQQGNRIYVLINRDTLVDFSPDEVDQRKTLKAAKLKKFPRLTVKKPKPAPAKKKVTPEEAPTPEPHFGTPQADKPLVFNDNGEGAPSSAVSTGKKGPMASPSRGSGDGQQRLSQELLSVYEGLHNAMKAGSLEEVKQHLTYRRSSSLNENDRAMIEAGMSLMPPNRRVVEATSDGVNASIKITAKAKPSDRKPSAVGTVSFVKEDGVWKVDQENWEMQMN